MSSTGNVYAWGVSYEGQLGDGYLSIAMTPVMIASGATAISSTANNVLIKQPSHRWPADRSEATVGAYAGGVASGVG